MPWIIAGGAVLSGLIGGGSSKKAAGTGAKGAQDAAKLQAQMYLMTRGDLSPYVQTGNAMLPELASLAGSGPFGPGGKDYISMAEQNLPMNMTQEELEKTPGYQFIKEQGLKAAQSAAAARGLGVSGAALKGAGTFATGLADNTYMNQFSMAQQKFNDILAMNQGQQGNLTNQFNRVLSTASLGENAAAQTGTQGTTLANAAGGQLASAGQIQGAGQLGATNALTSGINSGLGYYQLSQLLKGNTGAASGPTTWDASAHAPVLQPGQIQSGYLPNTGVG